MSQKGRPRKKKLLVASLSALPTDRPRPRSSCCKTIPSNKSVCQSISSSTLIGRADKKRGVADRKVGVADRKMGVSRPASRTRSSRFTNSSRRRQSMDASTKYNSYGKSSDVPKEANKSSTLHSNNNNTPPDPYTELHRNTQNVLSVEEGAPQWKVRAAEKLREKMSQSRKDHSTTSGSRTSATSVVTVLPETRTTEIYSTTKTTTPLSRSSSCSYQYHVRGDDGDDDDDDDDDETDGNLGTSVDKEEEEAEDFHHHHQDVDEMDEDDEEEGGVPQAVRSLGGHRLCTRDQWPSTREVVRERQCALMEELAREVSPNRLTQQLTERGFFNYSYKAHCRTGHDNHNLKNGKKKSMGKLLQLMGTTANMFANFYAASP